MKESDKVIEVVKEKLAETEKQEVVLALVERAPLLPVLDADGFVKAGHSTRRLSAS